MSSAYLAAVGDGPQVALNYYSQWLVNSCGVYPPEVWEDLARRNGSLKFRHHHNMQHSVPRLLQAVQGTVLPNYLSRSSSRSIMSRG